MKYKKLLTLIVITALLFTLSFPRSGSAAEPEETVRAEFDSGFGRAFVNLRKDFSFLNHDSGQIDWELALTAVTLSGQIYNDKAAEELFKELGYEYVFTKASSDGLSEFVHPAASYGYKHLTGPDGREANVFAVVVRGTQNMDADVPTDLVDGLALFRICGAEVRDDLVSFMNIATGKSTEQLQQEENYFFLTGHSLGGAAANYLSVDSKIKSFVKNDKGRIYTYTFSSPHTCLRWRFTDPENESNAFNIKDMDDAITHMAPYPGATTYGKDMYFGVNDLDDGIFTKLFPNAKGGSILEATKDENYCDPPWGHHDCGLCLVSILQNGLADGVWMDLSDAAAYDEKDLNKDPVETDPAPGRDADKDPDDPSGESSGSSSGESSGSSSDGSSDSSSGSSSESGTIGSDVSDYGIPNGIYRSVNGLYQEFTFYGSNGISLSAFGLTAAGTYEISGENISISFDFFAPQVWSTSFRISGDTIYIAGYPFYKM